MSGIAPEKIFDIAIIGAGPAGSFLAHKLGNSGLKVLVLDKLPAPRRKVCGEYLCPLGVNLLQSEGLFQKVVGGYPKLQGMVIQTARGTMVDTTFPCLVAADKTQRPQFGISVNRKLFDQAFLDLARDSGAEVKLGVDVKKIEPHAEHWLLSTSIGPVLTRVLIGADGRNSIVSKSLDNDIDLPQRRVALHYFAKDLSGIKTRKGEMHLFSSGAYIGVNPNSDSETNLSLVLDAEELKTLGGPRNTMNHYLKQSSELLERFGLLSESVKISAAYPIQHRTKSIVPNRHVALVGDAAGFTDPLTGEGMYYALLSSALLADCILADLKSNLNLSQNALDTYARRYQRHLKEKVLLNRGFQWLIKKPFIVELLASFLLTKKTRANIFIGIIGNIYSPFKGFLKLITA